MSELRRCLQHRSSLFSNSPLTAGAPILGRHIAELRQAIDSMRDATFTLPHTWNNYAAPTGPVTASDLIAMQNSLNEVRQVLVGNQLTFVSQPVSGGIVRATQIQQIRDGVR